MNIQVFIREIKQQPLLKFSALIIGFTIWFFWSSKFLDPSRIVINNFNPGCFLRVIIFSFIDGLIVSRLLQNIDDLINSLVL